MKIVPSAVSCVATFNLISIVSTLNLVLTFAGYVGDVNSRVIFLGKDHSIIILGSDSAP